MNKKTDYKEIVGKNISKLRKGLGFSQEKFAERIEMSVSGLSDIELAVNFPRIENLSKIADSLNVEVHELFIDNEAGKDKNCYKNLLGMLDIIKTNDSQIRAVYEFTKAIITNDIKKNKVI